MSLERYVAEDFARRYDDAEASAGVLCTTTVPRDAILALFSEGGETEVVLNPAELPWDAVTAERLA